MNSGDSGAMFSVGEAPSVESDACEAYGEVVAGDEGGEIGSTESEEGTENSNAGWGGDSYSECCSG